MRRLGIIGGTGPESTISYYRAIIRGVQEALGEDRLPPLTIESLSVFDVFDYCSRQDYDGLTDYLVAAVERLARAGVDVASLTALTPHIVFDRLQAASPIPLISAVEATRDAAVEQKVARLALLGTEYTMTQDFFACSLRDAGIEVALPNSTEIDYIQDRIARELEAGIVTESTRDGFTAIIRRLRDEEGSERVILGCTELPLLLNDDNSPLPCLDTVEIHTRALVAAITGSPTVRRESL